MSLPRSTSRWLTPGRFPAQDAGFPPEDGAISVRPGVALPTRISLLRHQAEHGPLHSMPLCAACDFDDWLGMCHLCLDIFEDIYSQVSTSRHSTGPYTPHATGRFSPYAAQGQGAPPVDHEQQGAAPALANRQPALPPPAQQRIPEGADAPMGEADPPAATVPMSDGCEAMATVAE